MTQYENKSFTVAQPGNNAKQWPKCGKPVFVTGLSGLHTEGPYVPDMCCRLDLGHKGDCKPAEDK